MYVGYEFWGLRSLLRIYEEPKNRVLASYFDSFSPLNAKRSTIKAFSKASIVSLTLRK